MSKRQPYLDAKARHQAEGGPRPFGEDLEAHLQTGYVISTPEVFLMMRPVASHAPLRILLDPWKTFPAAEWDAWMVYLLAGDPRTAFLRMPFWLPRVIYERRGKISIRHTAVVQQKIEALT